MAVMNPLGSRNIIIIDDNYIGEYSQAYMEVGKQIDDIIIKYIGILKGIIDDGSMKGLTAEKLYSFADTASMLLFKTAGVLCDNNKSNMQKFIQDIDEADREIYKGEYVMSNVLQIDRNGIDEAVNDLQELINEINEVNISKSKQEGDEGMAYTAIQEGEKIIENVKTDLQGLIQATADFIVKINGNFEDTDQRCAEQIKGEVK